MDQIVSAQPRLIPQMSDFLTNPRIWGCTTFCDHISDFVYVHLMRDFTVNETILAAKAFEKVLSQANHIVKHYHADNGAFAHKRFLDEVNRKDQKITFCAVGAHHQNGIIKNKNKNAHSISQNFAPARDLHVAVNDRHILKQQLRDTIVSC
jgi:hypothetical protein